MQVAREPEIAFIPVLYAMVEPRLRLVVTHAAGYLDQPSWFSVVHDPLIGPDRLVQPLSELDERSWRRLNDTPPPPSRVFCSERAEILLKIPVDIDHGNDRLSIVVRDDGNPLAFDGRLVERVDYALLGHGNRLLRAVLDAGLLLPSWDREAKPSLLSDQFSDQSHIALYVSERMAERLIQDHRTDHGDAPTGLVLLGERRVCAG